MFRIQKISNYGTSTPAVARTLPQGADILTFFNTEDAQKDSCKSVLAELSRHLVRCVEARDRIASEIVEGCNQGLSWQSQGRTVSLPSVPDLHSTAEAFLQSAKMAIRETALLVEPFYGVRHDHRFHKFGSWAKEQFGCDDPLTKAIHGWEPWVKRVVNLRNAVDHPENKLGGKLVVHNFRLVGTREEPQLLKPWWGLSGEAESEVIPDMDSIIEGIIKLGEDILVMLFYKFKSGFPLAIFEIPEDQRDPSCPKRLQVSLASVKQEPSKTL